MEYLSYYIDGKGIILSFLESHQQILIIQRERDKMAVANVFINMAISRRIL